MLRTFLALYLQNDSSCVVLAMDQSVVQRNRQLHQPKRRRPHHGQVSPARWRTSGTTLPLPDLTGACLFVGSFFLCVCLQSARDSLCVCHHRGGGDRPRAQRTNKGIHSSRLIPRSHANVATSAVRLCEHAETASLSLRGRGLCY